MEFKSGCVNDVHNCRSCSSEGQSDGVMVLAGNPNVGKSTLFNAITGLKQHTGNWSGKTVDSAYGMCEYNGKRYLIADVPGCYSLKSESYEETVARHVICYGESDGVVVVCDAHALERNLNLVLQICEATENVVVCINFAKEAEKQNIHVDFQKLEKQLRVPVVRINARAKKGIGEIFERLTEPGEKKSIKISYGREVEYAISLVSKAFVNVKMNLNKRYAALRVLENDSDTLKYIRTCVGEDGFVISKIFSQRAKAMNYLYEKGIDDNMLVSVIAEGISCAARRISSDVLNRHVSGYTKKEIVADKILTGRVTGFALMLLLLSVIFYITLRGSNLVSDVLHDTLFATEDKLALIASQIGLPKILIEMLIHGGYRVLAWVVAVMLPPMAIFFPLFTILEDVGYLPRVAFNLDCAFKKCNACGKQALTTCMGFGCNAVGITGARIIDSPRERLIAILTNTFIPCNGRFPALVCLITVFLTKQRGGVAASLWLSVFVVFAVVISMVASYILSHTVLKGYHSSFALELPRFRKPQFGEIVIRSLFTRTLKVLTRAVIVAFPSGVILWILSNVEIGDRALVAYIIRFFEPLGSLMGLDGTILTAFILGIPANEIVLPIALMLYGSATVLNADSGFASAEAVLTANGWNCLTAICAILFFIMHWPCATSLMTVKKETGSLKWTLLSFALPTLFGVVICSAVNLVMHFLI